MAYDDAEFFLHRLIAEGLATSSDDVASEIALTSQNKGVRPPSKWLAVGRVCGRTVAWIAGSDCGGVALSHPDAQDLDMIDTPKSYNSVEAVASVECKNGSNRRESSAGHVYIGRPFVSALPSKWWQFWKRPIHVLNDKSCDRAFYAARDIVMAIAWPSASPPDSAAKRQLERARSLLERVVAFRPTDSAGQFLLGRANDLLGDHVVAYARYQRAHSLNPDDDMIGRSLVFACLRLGKGKEAMRLSEHLLACYPPDSGLMSNHALVLLVAGQVADATAMVNRALSAEPGNENTQSLVALIASVRDGRHPRPDHWPP